MANLKTPYRASKEKRDNKIRQTYNKLVSNPENMKTAIERDIMNRFNLGSRSTVWKIVKGNSAVHGL